MKNFYSQKPVIPFRSVVVEMGNIIGLIKTTDVPVEVKRSAYVIIRNETSNGRSVINSTNPGGVQSDSGMWPDKWTNSIVATSVKNENRTGKERGFVVFDSLKTGIAFVCERLQARGMYVGGFAHKIAKMQINDKNDLATAYYKEWVEGDADYNPTNDEVKDFVSMYEQATAIFI